MPKCALKTEVYSRVCGYHRPVSNWNEGKREEFRQRRPFGLARLAAVRPSPGGLLDLVGRSAGAAQAAD